MHASQHHPHRTAATPPFGAALVALVCAACGNHAAPGDPDATTRSPDAGQAPTDSGPAPDAAGSGGGGDGGYVPSRLGADPRSDEGLARSELVRTDGALLYVLDAVTGVSVFDVSDPAAPARVAQVPFAGQPVSLEVAGGVAVAVTSPVDQQSELIVVDVRDPGMVRVSAPAMIHGTAYLVARTAASSVVVASWVNGNNRWADNGLSELAVVSLADLSAPTVVSTLHDVAYGWLLANEGGLLLFGAPAGAGSDLTVVDASAPDGSLTPRGTLHVEHQTDVPTGWRWRSAEIAFPATIRGGIARLGDAVGRGFFTMDLRDPAAPRVLASAYLPADHYPSAARIEGDLLLFVEPAWACQDGAAIPVDLRDPAAPVVGPRIVTPRANPWIVGSRLISVTRAVGCTAEFDATRAVSSWDLTDAAHPLALATETFSFDETFPPGWEVQSLVGDEPAGFALLAAEDRDGLGNESDALEVFRLDATGAHPAAAVRPGVRVGRLALGAGYTASLSSSALVVLPTPPAQPPSFTSVPIQQPMTDIEALPNALAVLAAPPAGGGSAVEFRPLDAPAASPTGTLALAGAPQWLRADGSALYAVTGPDSAQQYRVTLIDATDPTAPRALGSAPAWMGDAGDWYVFTNLDDYWMRPWWNRRRTLVPAGRTLLTAGSDADGPRLDVLAFDDPAAPQWTSRTVAPPGAIWEGALVVRGTMVFATQAHVEDPGGTGPAVHLLHRIDIADPRNPIVLAALPFPGLLIDASDDGSILYAARPPQGAPDQPAHTYVDALAYDGSFARTLGSADVGRTYSTPLQIAWRVGTTVYVPGVVLDFADPAAPVVSHANAPAFALGDPSLPPDVLLATETGGLGVFRRNADGTFARLGYARTDAAFPATPAYANGSVLVNGGTYGLGIVAVPTAP